MKTNVDSIDRVLRIILGLALLSLVFLLDSNARWFGLIGLVPLLTSVMSSCPLYSLLGINTCSVVKHTS